MRQVSPVELQRCVWDFVEGIAILPKWIESSASDKPGRGHYEWGNWSDAIRDVPMWVLGGPWRTIVADARTARLVSSVSTLHKLKDQFVWEIVEQIYLRAERRRQSTAGKDTVKTRIRSVFSWQRRHDVKKHSLMWFLDFAFVLSAYSEFQAHLLFSGSPIPNDDPARLVPLLAPAEFGAQSNRMEQEMFKHGFLPFYCKVQGLFDSNVLLARHLASNFCDGVNPPIVDMDVDVKETRGMPREEKKIDFMTPWLQRMALADNDGRWNLLVSRIIEHKVSIGDFEMFKAEVCRCIVIFLLLEMTKADTFEVGYVYDIAASTAVEQSEKELLVSLRTAGQKRKRTVSRRTLRSDLEERIQDRERAHVDRHSSIGQASSSKRI
eukprot:GFKZ01012782.1.p1 GENE.GFKZ01012782.1~~GFKZ01012782.1.p1  ORF type:complete len:380 (-),score=48.56 GFKZ01012782.1:717-1856(-)